METLNVGCRLIAASDPVRGAAIPIRLLYPTAAPARPERFGPYGLNVAMDAPVAGEHLPLVVVSHGNGGSSLTHRGLAAHLARAGFAVALVDHPGNCRGDNDLAFTAANLANRPRPVSLALDALLADAELGPRLASGVGLIGHSMGGYTGLAVAGGRVRCLPKESPDGRAADVPVTPDPRVKALVLFMPGAGWFMGPGGLSAVAVPIQLWTAELDEITPPHHGRAIAAALPRTTPLDHRVIAGGGHFAVQDPFPPAMVSHDFAPAHDPPDFDRAAFQDVLAPAVEAFLREALS